MKFAVRLSILGLAFIAMFSVIGLRLWFIQVAEGPAIARAAEEQTWIQKSTHAPRGDVYDRNGTLLVTSRMVPAVFIDRTFVQPEQREDLVQRLSAMLAVDAVELDAMYEKAGVNGRFEVAIVSTEMAYKVNEQLDALPGVEVVTVPERVYLSGPTLAHVVGHLGLPDPDDLEHHPELDPTVRIGQDGVEKVYDEFLQGTSGTLEYRVRRGKIIDQRPAIGPMPGNSVELTLDLELQQLVELALEEGIALSNTLKEADREAGEDVFNVTEKAAAVVLDARNFQLLALASVPDFDPQLFAAGLDEVTFKELEVTEALFNRAIGGEYPPGSTFKAITYTVFEEEALPLPTEIEGVNSTDREVNCDGRLVLPDLADGSPQVKRDWYYGRPGYGWLDLHDALRRSCNIFFWNIGLGTWQAFQGTSRENVIQNWAKDLSYGSPTGVDLHGEGDGTVPTRELFEQWAAIQRENPGRVLLDPSRLELASPWVGGDLMDFAIGQGAFTATPLQVAVSYAALANGGRVMEPSVVSRVLDRSGNTVTEISPEVIGSVPISEATRRALLDDLNRVVTSGTAQRAFRDFGPGLDQVGGKTGTSQTSGNLDNHAWFVGVAPVANPQYIVVVVIEEGGSGGRIAAPIARHILQYLMGNEPTEILEGERTD